VSRSWLPHWVKSNEKSSTEAGPRDTTPTEASGQTAEIAQRGAKLVLPASADVILESLKEVEDPELGISIVELGLIYGIEVEETKVRVRMTLTSPGCPIGPMLQTAVHGAVTRVYPDSEDVKVDLVWNPPWDPYKMASEEAKDQLGIW
jgi:metal-sulfur cluster biosynthetic enzyme